VEKRKAGSSGERITAAAPGMLLGGTVVLGSHSRTTRNFAARAAGDLLFFFFCSLLFLFFPRAGVELERPGSTEKALEKGVIFLHAAGLFFVHYMRAVSRRSSSAIYIQ
jgi:hypothetical protein